MTFNKPESDTNSLVIPPPPDRSRTAVDVLAATFDKLLGVVPDELDGPLREHLGFDEAQEVEDLRVIERERVREAAVTALMTLHQREQQEKQRRELIRRRIETHDSCQQIIDDLTDERDDLLAGIQEARRECRYEFFEGEYGDRLITAEAVRQALAPQKSATRRGRQLSDDDESCTVCTGGYFPGDHDDDCTVPDEQERAEKRLRRRIASHKYCQEILDGLLAEIDAAAVHIESVALVTETQLWSPNYYEMGPVLTTGVVLDALATRRGDA